MTALSGAIGPGAPESAALWRAALLLRSAWLRLAAAAALGAAAAGCGVALMATSAWLIVRAAQHPPVLTLMVAIVAVRAFGLGRGVLRYAERLISHDAAFIALGDVRVRVYGKLERLAPAGLPAWRRGDLLSRLVGDVDDMQDLALRGLLPIASAAVVFSGTLALAFALLPSAALVLAAALIVAGAVAPALWTVAARITENGLAAARSERAATVEELLACSTDLAALGAAGQWLDRVAGTEDTMARGTRRAARLAGLGSAAAFLAVGAAAWGALALGVPQVATGRLGGPALAVLVLTPLALLELLQSLPVAAIQLQRVRSSAVRILAVLDAPDPVPENPVPGLSTPARPRIQAKSLSVRWPGSRIPALAGIDLDLPVGSRVAVVGPSGSGKSTLLAALMRFVEPTGGSIALDGIDACDLPADDVRALISLCDQDAYLFDSTIAENVRLARPDASDAQIAAALHAAGLGNWIADLPLGAQTRVGEHGGSVSGGQRQRIALARALIADRPVLLLDEPVAGLEEPTAAALMADILAASHGRTTVLVTHRLDLLNDVDEVLVMDGGRVVERGTPAELMARPGGLLLAMASPRSH